MLSFHGGILLLAVILSFLAGCTTNGNVAISSGKTIRVFITPFEDAPDAPGSGQMFTSAFTTALQTVSSKVNARYIQSTRMDAADAKITGKVTIWKKGSWTEMATIGFIAECVDLDTGDILWTVSQVSRPWASALEKRTPEYNAEDAALDGLHKIRKNL
jgi:hypothetical protein